MTAAATADGRYWVVEGRFLAGPHPGADPSELIGLGVDAFVDLTETGSYRAPVEVLRHPIPDFGVPSPDQARVILDDLDRLLEADRCVYLHCQGGVGRTGTMVGLWLRRHRLVTEGDVLTVLEAMAGRRSPETPAQRRMVRYWPEDE